MHLPDRDERIKAMWPQYSMGEIALANQCTRNVVAGVLRRANLMGAKGAYQRELAANRMAPRSSANTGVYDRLTRVCEPGYNETALTERWADRKARKEREKNGTSIG